MGDLMKIEAGKYYRTRDGRKVGPMRPNDFGVYTDSHPWRGESNRPADCYRSNGMYEIGPAEDAYDLIAEWSEPMDLTTITTPFGLLDAETQAALKAHGGPYELYANVDGWSHIVGSFCPVAASTYRVKPQPPKPRERWLTFRDDGSVSTIFEERPVQIDAPIFLFREVLP
jgi:hypothetical protein